MLKTLLFLMLASVVLVSCAPSLPCKVVTFCREDSDQVGEVTRLLRTGFRYVGPLNQNGMNCSHVLWCK